MTPRDVTGLALSYAYAFALLLASEALGKRLRWPQSLTRKVTHVGAGLWVWGILFLFEHWYYGVIPFATFIGLNYAFRRWQAFKAMDTTSSTYGTVYFAFSATLLFVLLWRTGDEQDHAPIAVAAMMAMTLGDAAASLVGERWGRHHYRVLGHQRSWEGTAAMALFAFIGILISLLLLSSSGLSPNSTPLTLGQALIYTLAATAVATIAEGVSPAGSDNLTVPLLAGGVLWLLVGA